MSVSLSLWPQWRHHQLHSFLLGWMVLEDQVTFYLLFFGVAISWE